MKNLNVMHRSHGWVRDLDSEDQDFFVKKHNIEKFNALYFFVEPGFNLRSTEINAHLGLQQLKNLDENIEKRRNAASVYQKNLKDKIWLQSAEFCNPSPLAFGIVHENRNKIASNLIDNGIECRPLICGSIARHPFWKNRYGDSLRTPNADKIHDHGMYLPCHKDMSEEIIENICDIILMSV
jgi:CDP-6-deoxy-D-xylo-4-hexulose-3-dehydrase